MLTAWVKTNERHMLREGCFLGQREEAVTAVFMSGLGSWAAALKDRTPADLKQQDFILSLSGSGSPKSRYQLGMVPVRPVEWRPSSPLPGFFLARSSRHPSVRRCVTPIPAFVVTWPPPCVCPHTAFSSPGLCSSWRDAGGIGFTAHPAAVRPCLH